MEEISKKPMVDILSEMTGEQVVIDGDTYVAVKDGALIGEDFIADAKAEQDKLHIIAVKQRRALEIKSRLAAIDLEAVRPLRAIATQTSAQRDVDKLATLDAEAAALRAELVLIL